MLCGHVYDYLNIKKFSRLKIHYLHKWVQQLNLANTDQKYGNI